MFFKELYDDAASVGFKLAPEVKKYFRNTDQTLSNIN